MTSVTPLDAQSISVWSQNLTACTSVLCMNMQRCQIAPLKYCAEIGSTFDLTQCTIDYCDVVRDGCSKTAQASLEVFHNNAARAILGAPYRSSGTTLRNQLGWSTLTQRRKNHTAVWMYCCLRGHAPSYLQNTFLPSFEVHQLLHYTRQNSGVYMPRPRTSMLK